MCVCTTLISIKKRRILGWYKFVVSPSHFMGLSGFSAPHKPIRSVKGNSSPSFGWFLGSLLYSLPHLRFLLLALLPNAPPILVLPYCPSSLPLPLFCFLSSPPLTSPPLRFSPLPSRLSSPLCFRWVLSSLYYIVAVGESASDSNLSCPIISCCSVAEL